MEEEHVVAKSFEHDIVRSWRKSVDEGNSFGGRIIDNLQIDNLQIDNRQIDNRQIDNQNLQIDNLQITFIFIISN